jgi:hypothetical protein
VSVVYSVVISFAADSEQEANEIRADFADYFTGYAVSDLAVVAPVEDVLRRMELNDE